MCVTIIFFVTLKGKGMEGKTILVIDDDVDVVESISVYLTKKGYLVLKAFNVKEGMEILFEKNIYLILLDIMMDEPDDGIYMAQKLRKDGFTKPILMMSSISKVSGFTYDKENNISPVNDFIEKPVKPEILLEKIESLLKRGR
ncbi:MAG: response regulator [Chitinispirillaceae bacterium]|nr:response regulator [Chitinispirillaceae bacterium]